jgi:4-alpha-glucanotransferase
MFELFDLVRIDHFRGFVSRRGTSRGCADRGGRRVGPAPGRPLLERHLREFGDLPVIAEDLGVITPEVEALRDDFGCPV